MGETGFPDPRGGGDMARFSGGDMARFWEGEVGISVLGLGGGGDMTLLFLGDRTALDCRGDMAGTIPVSDVWAGSISVLKTTGAFPSFEIDLLNASLSSRSFCSFRSFLDIFSFAFGLTTATGLLGWSATIFASSANS